MNIQELMKQAKAMQKELDSKKAKLEKEEFVVSKQGIEIVVNGDRTIKKLKINPALLDPEDPELLEDLIIVAINDVMQDINDEHDKLLPKAN